MGQADAIDAGRAIDIRRTVNPDSCETILATLPGYAGGDISIRLASQFGADFFSDIWAAITVGTICRRYPNVTIIAWGQEDIATDSNFAHSLPGVTALQLSRSVLAEKTGAKASSDDLEYEISVGRGGVLETLSGKTRTLLEFDPQQAIAGKLQGENESLAERSILLRHLILRFRGELEFGYRNKRIPVHDRGDIGYLTSFVTELHTNAFKYSRKVAIGGSLLKGLRIVRLKAHLSTNTAELISRAGGPQLLKTYLEDIARGRGTHGIMEASISDFGEGIVDHFLSSARGEAYQTEHRRSVLQRLVHDTLSSSSNPASGQGLPNVLKAARGLRAFVSLRTGEFWMAQAFSDPALPPELTDVNDMVRTKVAGTHWQVLWPMGI